MTVSTSFANCSFQSTLPGWGATFPPMWCDESTQNFNPRSPDGERPDETVNDFAWGADFNPRSPDGERRRYMPSPFCSGHISIHAPRMGSDPAMVRRSPDGERPGDGSPLPGRSIFQSTLPGWGATIGTPATRADVIEFQSTLPGWGATFIAVFGVQIL